MSSCCRKAKHCQNSCDRMKSTLRNIPVSKLPALKLVLAALASIVAYCLPVHVMAERDLIVLVRYYSYWFLLALVLIYLVLLTRAVPPVSLVGTLKRHWPGLLLIVILTAYHGTLIDDGFKIIYDEHALSATAESLHREQQAFTTATAHRIDGETVASTGFVDKRPALFPLLLSLVHKLVGFRVENVFYFNTALCAVLLLLIYNISDRIAGRWAAIFSVLIFSSLPLLAENANGGGYELLNLCCIAALLRIGLSYLESPSNQHLSLLVLTSVLLANIRYESILYVLVPPMLFLYQSLQKRDFRLGWLPAISPLGLLLPMSSLTIFRGDERFMQTSRDNFFSIEHFPGNFFEGLQYLFDLSARHSSSLLLSLTGSAALFSLLFAYNKKPAPARSLRLALIVFSAVGIIVATNTALALSCYWGAWTDPATSRFSLPLQWMFVISVPLALSLYDWRQASVASGSILCVLFIITYTGAQAKDLAQANRRVLAAGNHWAYQQLADLDPHTEALIVTESSIAAILYGYAAAPVPLANASPQKLWQLRSREVYREVFFILAIHVNAEGKYAPLNLKR